MRQHGAFFDHNLQALRTVEEMELRYADFRGLNLTFEVREGIIKHSPRLQRCTSIRSWPSTFSTCGRRWKRNSST